MLRKKIHQLGLNSLSEQKEALRPLFETTIIGEDNSGNLKHKFTINGEKVCRGAWASAHNVSIAMIDSLAAEKKEGKTKQICNKRASTYKIESNK